MCYVCLSVRRLYLLVRQMNTKLHHMLYSNRDLTIDQYGRSLCLSVLSPGLFVGQFSSHVLSVGQFSSYVVSVCIMDCLYNGLPVSRFVSLYYGLSVCIMVCLSVSWSVCPYHGLSFCIMVSLSVS